MTTTEWREGIFKPEDRKIHYDSMDADDFGKGFLVNETLKALKDSLTNGGLTTDEIKRVLSSFFNPVLINKITTPTELISFFNQKIIEISPKDYEIALQRLPEFENGKMINYTLEEQEIFNKMKELQKFEAEFKKIYFKDKNHNKFGINIGTFLENLKTLLEAKIVNNHIDDDFDFFGSNRVYENKGIEINKIIEFVTDKAHNELVKPISQNGLLRHKTVPYTNGYKKDLLVHELLKAYPNLLLDTKIEFPFEEEILEKNYYDPFKAFFRAAPISIDIEIKDSTSNERIKSSVFLKNQKGKTVVLEGEQINTNNENILLELFNKYSNDADKTMVIKNLLKSFEKSTLIMSGITNFKDLLTNESDEKTIRETYIYNVIKSVVMDLKKFHSKYGFTRNVLNNKNVITYLDFKLEDLEAILENLTPLNDKLLELEKSIQNFEAKNNLALPKDELLEMIENLKITKNLNQSEIKNIELNVFLIILEHQLKGTLTEKILSEYKVITPFEDFKNGVLTNFKIKDVFDKEVDVSFKSFNIFDDLKNISSNLYKEEVNIREVIEKTKIKTKHTIYYNPKTEESLPIAANASSIRLRAMVNLLMNNFEKSPFFSGLAGDGKTTLIKEVSNLLGFPDTVRVQPTDFQDVVKVLLKGSQNIDKTTFESITPSLIEEYLRNGKSFVLILDEFIEVLNKFAPLESPTRIMEFFNMLLDPNQTIKINAPYTKKGYINVSIAELVRAVAIDNNPLSPYIYDRYHNFNSRVRPIIENTAEQWQNKNFIKKTVFNTLNIKTNEKLELLKTPTQDMGVFYTKVAKNIQTIMPELLPLFKSEKGREYFENILKLEKTLSMSALIDVLNDNKMIKEIMVKNMIPEKEYGKYVEKIITFAKIQNNFKYFNKLLKLENEYYDLDYDDKQRAINEIVNEIRFKNVLEFLEFPSDKIEKILSDKKLISTKEVANYILELLKSGEITNKTLIEKFGFENKFSDDVTTTRIEHTITSFYRKFEIDHLWVMKKGHLQPGINENFHLWQKEKKDSDQVLKESLDVWITKNGTTKYILKNEYSIKEIEEIAQKDEKIKTLFEKNKQITEIYEDAFHIKTKNPELSKEASKINSSFFFNFIPGISQLDYYLKDISSELKEKDIVEIEYKGEKIKFSKDRLPNFGFVRENMGKNDKVSFNNNIAADIEYLADNLVEIIYIINNIVKDPDEKGYENITMLTYRNIKDVVIEIATKQSKLSYKIDLNEILKAVLTHPQVEEFGDEIVEKLGVLERKEVSLFSSPINQGQ